VGSSGASPLTIFGREFTIPGYLVWGALIYAVFGNGADAVDRLTAGHLDFQQQRYEADFRFNHAEVRVDRAACVQPLLNNATVGCFGPRTRLKRKSASLALPVEKSRLTSGEPIHCVSAVPNTA